MQLDHTHNVLTKFFGEDGFTYGIYNDDKGQVCAETTTIKFLSEVNNRGRRVSVSPKLDRYPHFLLLDLSQSELDEHKVPGIGLPGHLVIQTGPAAYQAWVKLDEVVHYPPSYRVEGFAPGFKNHLTGEVVKVIWFDPEPYPSIDLTTQDKGWTMTEIDYDAVTLRDTLTSLIDKHGNIKVRVCLSEEITQQEAIACEVGDVCVEETSGKKCIDIEVR